MSENFTGGDMQENKVGVFGSVDWVGYDLIEGIKLAHITHPAGIGIIADPLCSMLLVGQRHADRNTHIIHPDK